MSTATRITREDHARLQRLARETGLSQQDVISKALDLYEREHFLRALDEGFAKLREDSSAWAKEQAERAEWDRTNLDSSQ
jgi:hypothetical protein